MLLQRLATGATGEIQARAYTGQRGTRTRMRSIQPVYSHCVYGRSLALAVQYETMHEFRRGFCTLVLSFLQSFIFLPSYIFRPAALSCHCGCLCLQKPHLCHHPQELGHSSPASTSLLFIFSFSLSSICCKERAIGA